MCILKNQYSTYVANFIPIGVSLVLLFDCPNLRGSCKKFCHWVRITSVLRFIKHIFTTNLQSIPPLLKHIFVTFLPSREKQINSLLFVSVGDTDK